MNLKIISSNIRFDNPSDGIFVWNNRKNHLASIINNFDTTLLGTQEARMPQLRELESLLPQLTLVDKHREWIQERMYPCIFVNKEKIEVIKSGDIWLSTTPDIAGSISFDSAFPRLSTWIHGKDINSKVEFLMFNTHLDHVKSETRINQIKVLISQIKKINTLNLPLILTGDFNEGINGEVYQDIFKEFRNLKDPWKTLNLPEEPSHHGFKETIEGAKRIDWILLDDLFIPRLAYFDKSKKNNIFPSDHYLVLVETSINA